MLFKSFKSMLAATLMVAGSAMVPATAANAGTSFSIVIGGGSGSYNHNRGSYYKHKGYGYKKPSYGYKQPVYGHNHRGFCGPRMALKKAHRIGLYRPHVSRIGSSKIVVDAWSRGYRAKLVFAKYSGHCKVVGSKGLF